MYSESLELDKRRVYDYIKSLARMGLTEDGGGSARRACAAFQSLLWDKGAWGHQEVVQALERVIDSEEFQGERGLQFINRCYYTLCNPWHYRHERQPDLERVIGQLQQMRAPKAENRLTLTLRRRMYAFKNSPYTACLLRQLRLGGYEGYSAANFQSRGIIGDVLPNYFYLYRSTTRTRDIEDLEERDWDFRHSGVAQKQKVKLRETYQFLKRFDETGYNPTTLPLEEFQAVRQHYHPERRDSFRSRSQSFVNSIRPEVPLQRSRLLVDEYLLQPVYNVPILGIQRKLRHDIQSIWDSFTLDVPTLNGIVILSFERALQSLLLPSFTAQSVQRFKAIVQHIGSMQITNILLNLVLGCPMVRFDLENRLGYLYQYFENSMIAMETWLIEFFEYMNVALVMNARQLAYL